MDITNTSGMMSAQNTGHIGTNEARQMERTEFTDNCWQDNAADAIHQAFSNMDEFVSTFKQSNIFDEA